MTELRASSPWLLAATLLAIVFPANVTAFTDDPTQSWYERETRWKTFRQFHFRIMDRPAYVVMPEKSRPGNPWIWRARFPGYHAEMDAALINQGYCLGYVDVAGLFGGPRAIEIAEAFYSFLVTERGFSKRPVLEGVSRGGLFVYNWTAKHPSTVAAVYCDTPVCDFKSWPAGLGSGIGSESSWKACLQAYDLNDEMARRFLGNPIDHASILAKHRIPILHIVSGNDRVVPPDENTYVLRDRLEIHGHAMEIISVPKGTERSKGHHFDHPAPERVIKFIALHAQLRGTEP